MSRKNGTNMDFITELMNNPGLAEKIKGAASTQEIRDAFYAGKRKQQQETKSGCLTWVIVAIVLGLLLSGKVSAAEIPEEIVDEDGISLSSMEKGASLRYTERLKNSGITTPEAIVVAEILDNAYGKSVDAGKTLITTYKNVYRR